MLLTNKHNKKKIHLELELGFFYSLFKVNINI